MGIKERQERERHALRASILTAARDLFVSEGYRNVTMRKIADRIEYSPAAIYSYFPSKDDIFFALAEEGFRLLAEQFDAAVAGIDDPLERLRRGLLGFYRFSTDYPGYFELMFTDRSVPSLNQDFHRFEFFQERLGRAEGDVRACIERGQFSAGLDPAAALHVLWAAMLGPATIRLGQRLAPGEDADALAQDVLESVLGGFTRPMRTTFVAGDCALSAHHEAPLAAASGVTDGRD